MTPGASHAVFARAAGRLDPPLPDDTDVARVLRLTAALASADDAHTVAAVAVAGFRQLLGGRSGSVNLFSGKDVETLASAGPAQPLAGVHQVMASRAEEWDELAREWGREPRRPLLVRGTTWSAFFRPEIVAPSGTLLVLVPFAEPVPSGSHAPGVLGCITVDRTGPAPRPDVLALAISLAEHVRAAVARTCGGERDDRRTAHLDLLQRLPHELATTEDLGELVERLAPLVRDAVGAELVDVQLRDGRAGRLFGAAQPHGRAAGVLRQWLRDGEVAPTYVGGVLCVPVRGGGELVGVLRARPAAVPMAAGDVTLLESLGAHVGCAVLRGVLHSELAVRDERLAISTEHERLAQHLRLALGERLAVAAEGLARADTDPEALAPVRRAVSSARTELRLTGHGLSYLARPRRGGLAATVRALVRDSASPGFGPELRLVGAPRPLPPAHEEALYRVAREAVSSARAGRAATVVVRLAFADDGVTLHVSDDGTALAPRSEEVPDLLTTVRALQRRVAEVGGTLEISNLLPRGVRTLAHLPTA